MVFELPHLIGLGLRFNVSGFGLIYAIITIGAFILTTILSRECLCNSKKMGRYICFTLITFVSTVGLFLADSLFTLYVLFEVMSLASYAWVIQDETPEAMQAGKTHLFITIFGGLSMLMGLFLLPEGLITLPFNQVSEWLPEGQSLFIPATLLFIGFGAKAGSFPLHFWLPKSYPAAPAPATALFSAILSKAGVFGVILLVVVLMRGNMTFANMVFVLGVVTMVLGALRGIFSRNLKLTLAYSSLSQIGFILVGVGLCGLLGSENQVAILGTVGHMVNHTVFKLVLFLIAGIVVVHTKKLDFDSIRGFGRGKPVLHIGFLLAMLGIAGVPLFSGYISKTLLHDGLLELINLYNEQGISTAPYAFAETLFIVSGGMTLCYMLRCYVCLFLQKPIDNAEIKVQSRMISPLSAIALLACALLSLVMGLFPEKTLVSLGMKSIPFFQSTTPEHIHLGFFEWHALKGGLTSIVIGLVLFAIVQFGLSKSKYFVWPDWLNIETLIYRPIIAILTVILTVIAKLINISMDGILYILRRGALPPVEDTAKVPVGSPFTFALGTFLDRITPTLNKTIRRKNPIEESFISLLAAGQDEFFNGIHNLTSSISYGLLLFCLGLFTTLVYLLIQ